MRNARHGHCMEDEDIVDFNFWPAFSDVMLSVVIVMIVSLFSFIFYLSLNNYDLKEVYNKEAQFRDAMAKEFGSKAKKIDRERTENTVELYEIEIKNNSNNKSVLKVQNDTKFQRITFGAGIIFSTNSASLNNTGKAMLRKFGKVLKSNISNIKEIQIQGHADNQPTDWSYDSNLDLAAKRSIAVFEFLQNEVGINPLEQLMSITSFGEYKPVSRKENDEHYNKIKLAQANKTKYMKEQNRRIEILLFYK